PHRHHPRHPGGLRISPQHLGHGHPQHRRSAFSRRYVRRHVSGRLQPRQPFPHGPHHFHRLRRGRRHRRHRKHRPPHGKRHEALRRHHARRPRDRLYRSFHEHLACRRLHSYPAYDRHRRPSLPRIRRHSQRGHRRLSFRHAHALRPLLAPRIRPAQSHLSLLRKGIQRRLAYLRPCPSCRAPPP